MKIIDLLTKISNGEEVPLKILVDGSIYKWDVLEHFYAREDKFDLLELSIVFSTPEFLQMEVKVIEDEIDIDIDSIEEFKIDENNFIQTELGAFKTRKMDIAFLNKINELVQAVKQLNKKIKSIKEK